MSDIVGQLHELDRLEFSFLPAGVFQTSKRRQNPKQKIERPNRERKTGITGVPFGRTKLSIRASGRKFSALESREGPVGPGIQGMPEKFDFHDFFLNVFLPFFHA